MNEIEKLTGIPAHKAQPITDLGTIISAKMYSNSNKKEKKNMNMNKNTFQQSTDLLGLSSVNGLAQAPSLSSPAAPPGEGVPGSPEEIPAFERKYGRRLNYQTDKIVQMHLQMGKVKVGARYSRCSVYISIKTETDPRYMIFMRANLTTANSETMRSIKKDNDKVLQCVLEDVLNEKMIDGVFTGRVRYKVVKGQKIQKYHRKNLPLSLVSIWNDNGQFYARFHLLGEDYDFLLDEPLSNKQEQFYQAQGTWELDEGTMSLMEAFGG